jgi:hypothetical protein
MLPPEVRLLEQRSLGAPGEATLGEAYALLLNYWRSGSRDRDIGLHLLFLAWYLMLEPAHITALGEDAPAAQELQSTFSEVHSRYVGPLANDAEFLYVVALMALQSPLLLGDQESWTELGENYRAKYRSLCPQGISADVFDKSNAYGNYFAEQVRVKNGF